MHQVFGTLGRLGLFALWAVSNSTACAATPAPAASTTGSGGSAPVGVGKVWLECPPQGAAPEGGMVSANTYQGQSCAGALHCSWYYADCPGLSGVGATCDCVSNKFVCTMHTCATK